MRLLTVLAAAVFLFGAFIARPMSGPWMSGMILSVTAAAFFCSPMVAWGLAVLSCLAALNLQGADSIGWLAGSWTALGIVPLALFGRKKQFQSEKIKLEERRALLQMRLTGLEGEQEKRRSAIREKEEAIQGISELYGLSKRFLATLDLEEVLQISEETLKKEVPLLRDEEIQDYLKYLRSLVNQGKISVEVLAKALPSVLDDIHSKERWGIVSGQLALGLQRVSLYCQVQESAIHDGLTGLLVRRHFRERLEEEAERAKRRSSSLVFLMVDLDHFKQINDTYGHLVGDVVLREVAHLVRGSVREIDLVGRFGGEEFGVVLPDADRDLGIQIADRIRQTAANTVIMAYDEQVGVTVSIGVSLYPQDGDTADQLIEQADAAMYQAKGMGRNRTVAASERK